VPFQIVSDTVLHGEVRPITLKARWGDRTMDQIRFTSDAQATRFACVLDPWGRKPVISLAKAGDGMAITVTLGGSADVWTWQGAPDDKTPSSLRGERDAQPLLALTKDDVPPAE
jgi:hypothetical protein